VVMGWRSRMLCSAHDLCRNAAVSAAAKAAGCRQNRAWAAAGQGELTRWQLTRPTPPNWLTTVKMNENCGEKAPICTAGTASFPPPCKGERVRVGLATAVP
jgi:hypothetical protein